MKEAIRSMYVLHTAVGRWSGTLLLILAALSLAPQQLQAEVAEAWVQRYSNVVSNSVDRAYKVLSDATGDIIVTGVTDNRMNGNDVITIKYSGRDGAILWQRRYNGAGNGHDGVSGLALDANGNVTIVAISGFRETLADGTKSTDAEFYIARYAAANGAILWETRRAGAQFYYESVLPAVLGLSPTGDVIVGLPSWEAANGVCTIAKFSGMNGELLWTQPHTHPQGWLNMPAALAIDGQSNVLITGRFESAGSYTVKFSPHGLLLWESRGKVLPAGYSRFPNALALDENGNAVVTSEVFDGKNSDIETTKLAASGGESIWTTLFDGASQLQDVPKAVAVDSSGDVIVTGFANSQPLISSGNFYTAKYAGVDGSIVWEQLRLAPSRGDPQSLAIDPSGNAIITGTLEDDYYTAKYAAANGALIWDKYHQGAAITDSGDYPQSVAVDPSGNVIVVGNSDNSSHTIKYDKATGAALWQQYHRGPANSEDRAMGIVIDANRNVIVTGISAIANGVSLYPFEYHTAKYSAVNGGLIWSHRHPGSERPGNVAVDGNGDVIVTGYSYTNENAAAAYTAKLKSSDGTLLWERRHRAQGNGSEISAVAIDSANNVVVTGSLNADYYTAKYATADGALLWQRSYAGGAGRDDRAVALTIDFAGNVLVTGDSASGQRLQYPVFDFYTAKYAATDGALLWERRFNGPTNGDDSPTAIAVDAGGNVFVTGRSSRGLSGGWFVYDSYTAKYAANDGALSWEKAHALGTNTYGEGTGVVVDSAGDLVLTGYSTGEFLTAKYAGSDGTLHWAKRGPTGVPRAVKITSGGSVVVAGDGPLGYYTAGYGLDDGRLLWERNYHASSRLGENLGAMAVGPGGTIGVTGASNGGYVSFNLAFDYATVVYREGLAPLLIERLTDGVRLRFTGSLGRNYALERAASLSGPWNRIYTAIAPASGVIEHLDETRPRDSAFYRAAEL